MANTIANFLVGLGFEFDEKGAKQIDSSIDNIKSSALQLGSIVAGAFGIKALTSDFAATNDMLGKFAQVLNVSANDVNAFGNAIEHEGGTLDSFMSQLQGLEQLRAGILQGDAEFIAIAGRAQIDTTELIEAQNATEAYLSLADQFQKLTTQQRINAANALGLDDASIRLLSKGRTEVSRIVEEQRRLRPVTEEMTRTAARFNDQTQILGNNIGRVADKISTALLPEINDMIESTNGWFDANQKIIDQNIDAALEPLVEHFDELAVTAGLFATSGILSTFAGMARYIPILGKGLAGIATNLSKITSVAGAGAGGFAVGTVISENLSVETNEEIGRDITRLLALFGNEEAAQTLQLESEAREQQGLGGTGSITRELLRILLRGRFGGDVLGLDPSLVTEPVEQPEVILAPNGVPLPESNQPTISVEPPDMIQPMISVEPPIVNMTPNTVESLESVDNTTNVIENTVNQRPIQVKVDMNLDGRIIDQKIIDVTERNNQLAVDDLTNNVRA